MSKIKRNNLCEYLFPSNYSNTSKNDVLDFLLNINPDTSGYLTKEIGFKKYFPELYEKFNTFKYPNECSYWSFTQKLYHFMRDDVDFKLGICEECNKNRCQFNNFKLGYKRFCCNHCSSSNENTLKLKNNTIEQKYGSVDNFNKIRLQHCIETNITNHGVNIWTNRDKAEKTYFEKYGVKSYMSTKEFREKSKEYYRLNFGCDTNSQIQNRDIIYADSFKNGAIKGYFTKKKNGTLTSSSIEQKIKNELKKLNINYIPQYRSSLYPYSCDFYLPDYKLYIEIQGHWSHGKHPFDENNKHDIEILNKWKSKCKIINNKENQYYHAVDIWTIRDPLKRKTSKENNLNYIEIFSTDLDECMLIINKKIKELEHI